MTRRQLASRFLIFVLVVLPLLWVVFSEEGHRHTDLLFVKLLGKPSVDFALDGFHPGVDQQRMRKELPELEWQCAAVLGPFGDHACSAQLGAFNGIPAYEVTFFFITDRLSGVEIVYPPAYHRYLLSQLRGSVGDPVDLPGGRGEAPLHRWRAGVGTLHAFTADAPPSNERPALLWLPTIL